MRRIMSSYRNLASALATFIFVSNYIPAVNANAFLSSQQLSMRDVDSSLEVELSASVNKERLQHLKEVLRPTFAALPKNDQGHLEHQTVRYVLHRFFVQEHGWYVKGLEPDGDVWRTASSQDSLKQWVPSYLLGRLEQRLKSRGVGLEDLAALAAALEDLIHKEAAGDMRRVFGLHGFSDTGLTQQQLKDAVASYMALFLADDNTTFSKATPSTMVRETSQFLAEYTDWPQTAIWLRGLEDERLGSVTGAVDFETAAGIAKDIGTRFGNFNDRECRDLKKTFMAMQVQGKKAGRVLLSDFYHAGMNSHWDFTEKVDYLRALGALDESDSSKPMVIVPNYIGSRPQCLEATSLYDVCCRNECEDLMGNLERNIAAASAPASRIAELVAALSSDTVKAPQNQSSEQLERLNKMADLHGGEVQLHGRLFAQWMHHAFPNECPFPHTAGTASPVTPDEWIGKDVSASEEERKLYVGGAVEASGDLPWHHVEEGLSSSHLSMLDVEKSLAWELQGSDLSSVGKKRIMEFKETLQATYLALPKNEHGHLEHQTVRYVLHRLFVQRHGWFIKGLEPSGDVWHTNASTESLKEWVPSYMLDRLEEKVGSKGVDLSDLAALAAALEDLVRKEASARLDDVYEMLGFPKRGAVSNAQANEATTFYLVLYLMDEPFAPKSPAEARSQKDAWIKEYEEWDSAEAWLRGIEREHNPLQNRSSQLDFATVSKVVMDIGARYSAFNDKECRDLKQTLMGVQNKSGMPGRVRLADFYKVGLHTHWEFTEKPEYLKALGALDRAANNAPMLIMPNYLGSRPNCLDATSLYAVCCRNECEDLMVQLERRFSMPTATPHRIAGFVATLRSDTVTAPWQVEPALLARLDSIAAMHGGEVNLHGRLFAQWMHHAFPNECPYPHEAGIASPLSPSEWMGAEIKASKEDRESHAHGPEDLSSVNLELPWSHTEELLGSKQLNLKGVEESLEAELSGSVSKERLAQFKLALQATYVALPKNAQGHLEHQTMRYVLHRLFVQRHGWFIKGLEPDGDVWHTQVSEQSLKDWVPSYMLDSLEKRVGTRGVDLNDLAALAAALEDLANKEANGRMEEACRLLDFPTRGTLTHAQATEALTTYLVMFLMDGNFSSTTAAGIRAETSEWISGYENWKDVQAWNRGMEGDSLGNTSGDVDFSSVSQAAVSLGASYGWFNDRECKDLKKTLMGMQGQAGQLGRIRLTDFYSMSLHSHWDFNEKPDYLRALGALDESVAGKPMVILTNYIAARPQCLEATNLYDVCCRNECEDLMAHLERQLASPRHVPHRIVELVSALSSDTVKAPRQLSQKLLARLEDIAAHHGGQVNIHGRLFAQWMHHAFPNECPFPHEAGTSSPLTPDEWIGQDVKVSKEDREKFVEANKCKDPSCMGATMEVSDLPWSHTEELLGSLHVSTQDADKRLEAELAGTVSQQRVMNFKKALQTTYVSLPKNSGGHLEHQTVRYVLHRLFVQERGWYIKGLEPNGDVWHTQASPESLKDWVPSYLLQKLEERMGSRGIDLHDLAALAAALEDLAQQEASASTREVYRLLGLGNDAKLSRSQAQEVITTYLTMYLMDGNYSSSTPNALKAERTMWISEYEDWQAAESWLRGVEHEQMKLVSGDVDFATVSDVVSTVGARYSSFNDRECKDLKRTLTTIKSKAQMSGRVRLADFYKMGLHSHWEFVEKREYLSALGALDETNKSDPMVIIPNYIGARPNCLEATNLYDVCCRNECEDLMGHLERQIAAPEAAPHRITEIVSSLGSDTVKAPRQLPASLLARMNSIASERDGKVRLHGRLFAQWMHHAFPNECPFPHEAGTANPLTPDEWIGTGVDVSASREERQKIVDADSCGADGQPAATEDLPWSDAEELLAPLPAESRSEDQAKKSLLCALLLTAVSIYSMFAASLAPHRQRILLVAAGKGVSWQLLLVGWFATIAFATSMVDLGLFAFVICAGLVSNFLASRGDRGKAFKCEKSLV